MELLQLTFHVLLLKPLEIKKNSGEIFNERIEIAHDALAFVLNVHKEAQPKNAPILFMNGALGRLDAEGSVDELYNKAKKSLDRMVEFGVTTVESKSGYGLDLETEIKQLEVAHKLNEDHPIDLVHTFLGAHAVPVEYKNNPKAYIELLVKEIMPKIKEMNLAEFCDVFCEEGVFSVEESEYILKNAKDMGYKLKIHADEIKI